MLGEGEAKFGVAWFQIDGAPIVPGRFGWIGLRQVAGQLVMKPARFL